MASTIRPILSLGLSVALALPSTALAQAPRVSTSVLALASEATVQQDPEEDSFSHMTFRQRERLARRVFRQAEGHHRRGQLEKAIERYEQVYRLVPSKHGLAFIIGNAYRQVGNCEMAGQFLQRLVTHGESTPKLQEKVDRAKLVLQELRDEGCLQDNAAAAAPEAEEEAPLLEDSPEPQDDPLDEIDNAAADAQAEREAQDEPEAPVYDGPTVDQARLDENPLGESSEAARRRGDKAFRRANSRGFLISGIVLASIGALGLGTAGFLHWKTHDTAEQLIRLTKVDPLTQFPTTDFSCRYLPAEERANGCPTRLISDMNFYQQYTPIAYGVGGGLLGLGLTFILIKKIRMARYRKRKSGRVSWSHPERLHISPARFGRQLGARAALRF